MNTIKKVAAGGGAVAIILCWPLAVGQIGQHVIEDIVSHSSNNDIAAKIVSYDRGYLTSTVTTEFDVVNSGLKAQLEKNDIPTTLTVKSHVTHGIFSLDSVSELAGDNAFPVTLKTKTGLNGNTEFHLTTQEWNYTDKADGATLSTAAGTVSGHASTDGKVDYQFGIPWIKLHQMNEHQLAISNFNGTGQGQVQLGYFIGKQHLKMDKVDVTDGAKNPRFAMQNISYKVDTTLSEKEQRFNSHMLVGVEKFLIPDAPLPINNFVFDFSLNQFDIQSLRGLAKLYQAGDNLTDEDIKQALPFVDSLFNKGFSLTLKPFSFDMGEGHFKSDLHLQVPQGTEKVTKHPLMLVTALKGNSHMEVSKLLAEKYPDFKQAMEQLITMKIVAEAKDNYTFDATIAGGQLEFAAGNKIPLLSLLMGAGRY